MAIPKKITSVEDLNLDNNVYFKKNPNMFMQLA